MAPVRQIEALLLKKIGLNSRSIGSSMITIAVQARRRAREVGSDEEYLQLVESSPAEFQALVEEVVVPETWFFRDRESFALLAKWAAAWFATHHFQSMRLLSAPCSSGEEPYTMAMALLGAGISGERFSVEAVDISEVALAKARRAVYGRNSFRAQTLDFRDRFFEKTGPGWRLLPEVTRQVHFLQSNLIDVGTARQNGEIDVIFCRNLLIYFDAEARARVMNRLRQMLAPDGVLFLGHAEGGIAREFGFEPVPAPMAFAFRRATPRKARGTPAKLAPLKLPVRRAAPIPPVAAVTPAPLPPLPLPRKKAAAAPASVPAPLDPEQALARARQLADQGLFDQARAACQGVLDAGAATARAYYLLALIEEGAGDAVLAESYYRKTLYMEPDHEEALVQLSLLEQKQGMVKAARQLRERAQRVRARKQESHPQ